MIAHSVYKSPKMLRTKEMKRFVMTLDNEKVIVSREEVENCMNEYGQMLAYLDMRERSTDISRIEWDKTPNKIQQILLLCGFTKGHYEVERLNMIFGSGDKN